MANAELLQSWAVTLRHLAASRFYLPENLLNAEAEKAWAEMQHFLHNNELELALDEAEVLGEIENAPSGYWAELLRAAENMSLKKHAARYKAKV
jgi:hypothetical protein